MEIDNAYESFIYKSRYARWLPDEGRREEWGETVGRYVDFMVRDLKLRHDYDVPAKTVQEVRQAILNRDVLPSMRSLMTAGPALAREHIAGYNCSYLPIDHPRAFDEALYILMNGTGVGFSVEADEVSSLPAVPDKLERAGTIRVKDSKLGWAEALKDVVEGLYAGKVINWDLSDIRPAGAPLLTFGGRASGPEPLNDLLNFVVETFARARGRKLTPLEAHEIVCKIGEVVVVGGVRRCLPSDALVSTPGGLVHMENISVGDEIITGGRKSRVTAKVDSGRQRTVVLKHRFGQAEMTPNHRIAVFDGVDSYTFKEAASVVPGDRVVWDLEGFDGTVQSLPSSTYEGHFNTKDFSIPDVLDTDTAWLIGLVHGDGHVHPKGIEISSSTKEWSTLERANSIFDDKFGVSGVVSRDSHGGEGIRLRINSTGLALWFAENVKVSNEPIAVPGFVSGSQKDTRAAYLAGVLDSDGRVRNDGVIEQATTVYPEFAEAIRTTLMGMGITTKTTATSRKDDRLSGVNGQDYQSVFVSGDTSRFRYVGMVGKFSEKLDGFEVAGRSPVDFTYPAEWGLAYRNRSTKRTTAVDRGLVDEGFAYAPSTVESVEFGEVQQTWDIEVEDIHEFTADGLLTHNSALISLSDLSDQTMRDAKHGQFWEDKPHLSLANNSAVYNSRPTREQFDDEFDALIASNSGERGIFSRYGAKQSAAKVGRDTSHNFGTNPCGEILLRPGGFCNLSTVTVRPDDDKDSLLEKVRIATIIGTWQSTFVEFNHLRDHWRKNAEEERLLGVSLGGVYGNTLTNGKQGNDKLAEVLTEMRQHARAVNERHAADIGIAVSASITTIKPEGSTSQLTGVSSGAHPWHDTFYNRNVRGDEKDPLTQFLIASGVPNERDKVMPENYVFTFPIAAPEGAITREEVTALDHLEFWKTYKENWTEHNPSVTISVREHEWPEVREWVWDNFDIITGLSFLPHSDHVYEQAPFETIDEEQYRFNLMMMPKLDWKEFANYELEDSTKGSQELACSAGGCSIDFI